MNAPATELPPVPVAGSPLDREACRRARLSRDARFDGEFYLGVSTTGIYCRPICPARPPAENNVRYFQSAALAAQAGFRPCLRCRPESAPGSPAWNGTSTTVRRALQLLEQGALNGGSMAELAARLGVGERYLRKLFQRELGVSPGALALNQRLLFAKKLLAETTLPVTEVAFAAGFSSVRRFNGAVLDQFRLSPTALRKRVDRGSSPAGIHLQLHYRPPYDWEGVAGFFSRHAIPGVEEVTPTSYRRNVVLGGAHGSFAVSPAAGVDALQLTVHLPDQRQLMALVARVRRMFDLDANPGAIEQVLARDARLAPLLQRFPGIRSPAHWSTYESAVRGIVGQQISTRAARSVLGKLAAAAGSDDQPAVFPYAESLAGLGDEHFPMPAKRREALRGLCQCCAGGEDQPDLSTVAALRGVGAWTTGMVALRGLGHPDTLPQGDLGLERAWERLPGAKSRLRDHAVNWRPWRSYAANLLWRTLTV